MSGLTILHVEDSQSDLELTGMAWRQGGHPGELIGAGDCQTAFARLRESAVAGCLPALIILDLNLPGCHGTDVLDYLRREELEIPVVVLTSSNDPRDRQRCLALGAVEFLVKPLSYQELREVVARLAAHLDGAVGT